MNFHLLFSPNPIAHTPCHRLREEHRAGELSILAFSRKCCLVKTQGDSIASGDPIVYQMNQARAHLGLGDGGTPARGPFLRTAVKAEQARITFSTDCCPRILSQDFSLDVREREEA